MPQETLRTASPVEIRDELQTLVLNDLLGPAGGPEEEVDEGSVSDRYLVGMLAPKRRRAEEGAVEPLALGGQDAVEDGAVEAETAPADSLIPSSFGLTFRVLGSVEALKVTARWGRYERTESATAVNDRGEPKLVWKRVPVEGVIAGLALSPRQIKPLAPFPDQPEIVIRGICRKHEGDWIVTLFLVNGQEEKKRLNDEMWLFQAELMVEATDGKPVFIRRAQGHDPEASDPQAWNEEHAMAMQYRHIAEFAVGHGVAVHADPAADSPDHAVRVRTASVPAYEVPMQTPPTAAEIPDLAGINLDMKELALTPDAEIADRLAALPAAYGQWIVREQARCPQDPTLAPYTKSAASAMQRCQEALRRIQAGVDLLRTNPDAAYAFRFANEAMWQQRIRTLYAEQVRRGLGPDLAKVDVPANRTWYPFQLAFILLNLPGLTDIAHTDRTDPDNGIADLLWFPTGGGKTEAYLGLTAYTLAIRRLQGEVAGRSGQAGVAVLMRYTLRLLTLQQFQRATTLICACELIRKDRLVRKDARLGLEPYRIGLWVGRRTTPNRTDQSAEAILQNRGGGRGFGGTGTPVQLKHCPWCGHEIGPGRDIVVERFSHGRGRTFQFCGDPAGQCPFSRRRSPDEGIPILLVDEEIYRRLPALLIATVDKFAQMPWKGETQTLFGRVNGYCPRHGFRSPEIEDTDTHQRTGDLPACKTVAVAPLRPPDLIIQDELHLISGPLGTMVGLYETAVDRLASWTVDGKTVRPKVIASTATIRRAADQVHQIFQRKVAVFPPQGTDVRDNFFSVQRQPSPQYPGRRYMGICAPGRRTKSATVQVLVSLLSASQKLYLKHGRTTDPWMTLVSYFNSMRELGGTRRLVDDRVRSALRDMDRRGLARRGKPVVEELTSRVSGADIPRILDLLEVGFDPANEERRREAQKSGHRWDSPIPVDVVMATNMLSVGVDVKRLGLMLVNGQPKTTGEYIQASSRVGRTRNAPGLVVTLFNWARPRDMSHYETFEHYHATFYQHVEALSVTPFAARALDRGLTAVLVSLVRLAGETFNSNKSAADVETVHELVQQAIAAASERATRIAGDDKSKGDLVRKILTATLDEWQARAERPTGGKALGYQQERDGITAGLLQKPGIGDWDRFTCLLSLRDVEPSVGLILDERELNPRAAPAEADAAPDTPDATGT